MSTARPNDRRQRLVLAGILGLALALRLGWVLSIEPGLTLEGGDAPYYLTFARHLALGTPMFWSLLIGTGPSYPLYLGIFYRVLPEAWAVQGARVGQAVIDTLMCLAAFDLGRRLFDIRAGLLTALLLAVDLRFIVQVGAITTETLFIFFLVSGVWAFVIARAAHTHLLIRYAGAGLLLTLAAFTRPVALPIPVLLFASLLLPKPSRAQLITVGVAISLIAAAVIFWSIRTYLIAHEWVIISDGLAGNFWMGSRGDGQWHGSTHYQEELDELRSRYQGRAAYVEDAFKTIAADPPAYLRLLSAKLAQTYLQPYGTEAFPGQSLKSLGWQVLQGQVSITALFKGEGFWPKLYIYVFHFVGLIGGVIGLWWSRREWLKVLPVSLPIAYFTIAYTLLTIIPRYLFPLMPFYMILAAYAGVALAGRWAAPRPAAGV